MSPSKGGSDPSEFKINVLLIFLLAGYLCLGAAIFLFIEAPYRRSVERDRTKLQLQLLESLRSLRNVQQENWTLVVDDVIEQLEPVIEDYTAPSTWREWNFATCLYLTVTAITTIGYGDIAPITQTGRIIMLFYSVIGIPLNLVFLDSFGDLLAKLTSKILRKVFLNGKDISTQQNTVNAEAGRDSESNNNCGEFDNEAFHGDHLEMGTIENSNVDADRSERPDISREVSTNPEEGSANSVKADTDSQVFCVESTALNCLSAFYALYTILGALFVFYTEQDWTLIDAVYCTFISLTTIGFGDLIPGGGTLKEYSVLRPVTYLFFTYAGLIVLSATIHASPTKIRNMAKGIRTLLVAQCMCKQCKKPPSVEPEGI
ncbi:two pore potassium channel protein sup-9-like [Ptychodera flava]|uniref:two pore potassium channel protein sup-9-like n=1 Tax=Ptychodera flava TaxID=63121 RepID=UPI003969FF63